MIDSVYRFRIRKAFSRIRSNALWTVFWHRFLSCLQPDRCPPDAWRQTSWRVSSSFLLLLSGLDLGLGSAPHLLSSALDFLFGFTSSLGLRLESILKRVEYSYKLDWIEKKDTRTRPLRAYIKQSPWVAGLARQLATYPSEKCFRIKLPLIFRSVVYECKSSGSAATELSLQTEDWDFIDIRLVRLGKARLDVCLWDIGNLWVDERDVLWVRELVVYRYQINSGAAS